MCLQGKACEGVDWTHQGKGKGPWRAVVDTVMNLRVP
jgi:hypothetical protein